MPDNDTTTPAAAGPAPSSTRSTASTPVSGRQPSANAEAPRGTTTSTSTSDLKTPKDRPCPFCNQPFTSSSLGRHLDLYIKPRNPKPPDGVHDVEAIRQMRGGITRRQPRAGTKPAVAAIAAARKARGNGHVNAGSTAGEEEDEEEDDDDEGDAEEDETQGEDVKGGGLKERKTARPRKRVKLDSTWDRAAAAAAANNPAAARTIDGRDEAVSALPNDERREDVVEDEQEEEDGDEEDEDEDGTEDESTPPATRTSSAAPPQQTSLARMHVPPTDSFYENYRRDHPYAGASSNHHKWTATGVINNLPTRRPEIEDVRPTSTPPGLSLPAPSPSVSGQAQRLHQMRRDASGNRVQRPDYWESSDSNNNNNNNNSNTTNTNASGWKAQDQAETGRAAELALRELLASLEASSAKAKSETPQAFEDVDFFALSFPGLCLALLPAPSTLFTASPFPGPCSWFLSPPRQPQFDSLKRVLVSRIKELQTPLCDRNVLTDAHAFKYHLHLGAAFENWEQQPEPERERAWKLEVARAFAREKERNTALKKEHDAAKLRIQHLEAEFDRLSRCQLPRDYLLHPPNTIPVSESALRDLKRSSELGGVLEEVRFDPEALIERWKAMVRYTSRPTRQAAQTGGADQGQGYAHPHSHSHSTSSSNSHSQSQPQPQSLTQIYSSYHPSNNNNNNNTASNTNNHQLNPHYEQHHQHQKSHYQPTYTDPARNALREDMLLNGSVFGVNGPMPRSTTAPAAGGSYSGDYHQYHSRVAPASNSSAAASPAAAAGTAGTAGIGDDASGAGLNGAKLAPIWDSSVGPSSASGPGSSSNGNGTGANSASSALARFRPESERFWPAAENSNDAAVGHNGGRLADEFGSSGQNKRPRLPLPTTAAVSGAVGAGNGNGNGNGAGLKMYREAHD